MAVREEISLAALKLMFLISPKKRRSRFAVSFRSDHFLSKQKEANPSANIHWRADVQHVGHVIICGPLFGGCENIEIRSGPWNWFHRSDSENNNKRNYIVSPWLAPDKPICRKKGQPDSMVRRDLSFSVVIDYQCYVTPLLSLNGCTIFGFI